MSDTVRRALRRQRVVVRDLRRRFRGHGPARLFDVVLGLGIRPRWRRLVERHDHRGALGLLATGNAIVSISVVAVVAELSRQGLVFPSLGPTAFLLIYRPHAIVSSPRNTICGHLVGAGSGLVALAAMGLVHHGAAPHHMTAARVGAAAISLGLTTGGMIWLDVPHPPAAATTLIVGLGFLDDPAGVGMLMLGVLLLVGQGLLGNRLAGIDYPLWAPHERVPAEVRRAHRLHRDSGLDAYPEAAAMPYLLFVDAVGDSPLGRTAAARLRAALGDADRLTLSDHEWTAYVTVQADDLVEAAHIVEDRVRDADRAAGLDDWTFRCYGAGPTMSRLPEPTVLRRPRLHLPHRRH